MSSLAINPLSALASRWSNSFRAKLYTGFFGIALLTLFATGFALYLFNQFGGVVNSTAGEAIPELLAVMSLSSSSALLAASGPELTNSKNVQDLGDTERKLTELIDRMQTNMIALEAGGFARSFESIKQQSTEITNSLVELKKATLKRLELQEQLSLMLVQLRGIQGELVDTLTPIVYGATSLSKLLSRRSSRQDAMRLKKEIQDPVGAILLMMETRGIAYRIAGLLAKKPDTDYGSWMEQCLSMESLLSEQFEYFGRIGSTDRTRHVNQTESLVGNILASEFCQIEPKQPYSADHRTVQSSVEVLVERINTVLPELKLNLESGFAATVTQIKLTPVALAETTIDNLRFALDIKAEGNLLIGLLTAATGADDQHTITSLYNQFRISMGLFRSAVNDFQGYELAKRNPILATQVLDLQERFAEFGVGDESLFVIRRNELSLSREIGELLAIHRNQATSLTAEAGRLVSEVRANVDGLQKALGDNLTTATLILIGVCAGSLFIAGSIAHITTLHLSRHEADLREANNEAELLNQELDTFNYSVSHDLRAPLRSLSGFSQALIEDYGDKLDAEGKTYLMYLKESSREMGELITGLLRLSRSTRGDLTLQTVNLSEMAQGILDNFHANDPGRNVVVEITPDLEVRADRRLIWVVLENLLGNAWKYTSKRIQAEIVFGSIMDHGVTTFFVRDNGAGFDMNYGGKLFQPFQRLHKVKEFEGTGIGLATVQRIIRRHGGTIRAHSAVDKGSTFFFTLEGGGYEHG
ncbi:MAG: hypothetical protein GY703_06420 [Gammaproteobacteria bacterium]|nr:hypothetical protein [Gammaproteobacteria bacterium]